MKAKPLSIIITCEHGSNRFPKEYEYLFQDRRELLESHRGYDPGAIDLAKKLSLGLKVPHYSSTTTRLLIDLNRSPHNPRRFSEITGRLSVPEKKNIQECHYLPYRKTVESEIAHHMRTGRQVLHLSVHTFSAMLRGKVRSADIGFLYDPARTAEVAFCLAWQKALHRLSPDLQIRRNYPYRGTSDGFTAYLRKCLSEGSYLGVELEVNQKLVSAERGTWPALQQWLLKSLEITRTSRSAGG